MRTCDKCSFYARRNSTEGECRRFPPSVTLFVIPGKIVGMHSKPEFMKVSAYPPVDIVHPECGEFKPRLADA